MIYTKTYHRILDTATDKFRKNGYHATGIAEILRDSNTTRGSLYHYFPDGKETLAVAVLENIRKSARIRLEGFFSADRDPVGNICNYFRSMADGIDNPEENLSLNMLLMETVRVSPRLCLLSRAITSELDGMFFAEVERCALPAQTTCQLASVILSMLLGAVDNCYVLGDSQLLRNLIPQIPLLFLANGYHLPHESDT